MWKGWTSFIANNLFLVENQNVTQVALVRRGAVDIASASETEDPGSTPARV
jgi:hypothetical protein